MNIIKRLATGVVMLAGTWSAAGQEIIEYVHTDALGSPVAVSDAAGNVTERTAYEPYGALVGLQQADVPRFTGHVADSGTGLTYMQQRYYDPQIGLLLSADPVTAYSDPVAAFNRYRYANSSPYKFIDPDGRRACGQNTTCALKSGAAGSTSYINDGNRKFPSGTEQRRYDSASAIVDKVSAVVESRKNESPDVASKYFSKVFQPVSNDYGVEISANIKGGDVAGWYLRDLKVGSKFRSQDGIGFMAPGGVVSGGYNIHTHPLEDPTGHWNEPFSGDDIMFMRSTQSTGYVSTPSMKVYKTKAGGAVEEVK
ncbi:MULTISPECIES: RHS repeat-associated core domain-containing protein [unclassified Stenotrophomonas]|uniref:RHS repeat domain-containing protein n=1 Tax=unclassified Stenotrophomonas TaxID=196198 RepID=UPI001E42D58C|nr:MULTISPECIES: RHS repeat-associated core domain-containing protein [unclassified Stenotrophomonas]